MIPKDRPKTPTGQRIDPDSSRVNSGPDPSGAWPLEGGKDPGTPGGMELPKNDRRKRGDLQKRDQ